MRPMAAPAMVGAVITNVPTSFHIEGFRYQHDDKRQRQEQRRTEPFHPSRFPGCRSARGTGAREKADERYANERHCSRGECDHRRVAFHVDSVKVGTMGYHPQRPHSTRTAAVR